MSIIIASAKAYINALNKLAAYKEFDTGATFHFRNLEIHPFSISHDAADPVGFRISDAKSSFGYCTDTGRVSQLMKQRLSACHALVIESNHDAEMLKNGSYPPYLKQRIRSSQGHLENGEAAAFMKDLLHNGLEHVVLAHLSEENNDPEIAYQVMTAALGRDLDKLDANLRISVAEQYRAGELIELCVG